MIYYSVYVVIFVMACFLFDDTCGFGVFLLVLLVCIEGFLFYVRKLTIGFAALYSDSECFWSYISSFEYPSYEDN